MTTHQTTSTPARREHQHQVPKLPKLSHLVKHVDVDGTVTTMCGKSWKDTLTPAGATHTPCAACHAAKHLYEVMP